MINLSQGTELTIVNDTIDNSGCIQFTKGQKVVVREVVKYDGCYRYDSWINERIIGVKLIDEYGIYFLSLFEETQEEQQYE